MPQQRIHEITAKRLARLKTSINAERERIGEKKLTAPDIIEEVLQRFELERNNELRGRKSAQEEIDNE